MAHHWSIAARVPYPQRRPAWITGWRLPVLVVAFGASAMFWRAAITQTNLTVASQIDYEDAALCGKFGFPPGTDKYMSCKLDLLDLRRSHEDLMTAASLP